MSDDWDVYFTHVDGKPASMLPSARRLDGSIQREQVGLESDALHDDDDFADLTRKFFDRLHGFTPVNNDHKPCSRVSRLNRLRNGTQHSDCAFYRLEIRPDTPQAAR